MNSSTASVVVPGGTFLSGMSFEGRHCVVRSSSSVRGLSFSPPQPEREPTSTPSTSRPPAAVTPVATTTARDTTRPLTRALRSVASANVRQVAVEAASPGRLGVTVELGADPGDLRLLGVVRIVGRTSRLTRGEAHHRSRKCSFTTTKREKV